MKNKLLVKFLEHKSNIFNSLGTKSKLFNSLGMKNELLKVYK